MNLLLFDVWEGARVCLNEITPLLCTLTLQDQYPLFLYSKTPQGAQSGVAAVTDVLVAATSLLFTYMETFFVHTVRACPKATGVALHKATEEEPRQERLQS